jgi:tryptophan-rich sensory protein
MNILPAAVIAIVPVALAAALANLATMPKIGTWYAGLAKPWFNPPNSVFGPVWLLLYAKMAFSFFRILTATAGPWTAVAIALFLLQIALNAGWSFAFFAGESPKGAMLIIVALWWGIVLTTFAFWQIDRVASMLVWPYLAWVSFAAVLNGAIAALNPE